MEENRADLPENSTAETESQPITKGGKSYEKGYCGQKARYDSAF